MSIGKMNQQMGTSGQSFGWSEDQASRGESQSSFQGPDHPVDLSSALNDSGALLNGLHDRAAAFRDRLSETLASPGHEGSPPNAVGGEPMMIAVPPSQVAADPGRAERLKALPVAAVLAAVDRLLDEADTSSDVSGDVTVTLMLGAAGSPDPLSVTISLSTTSLEVTLHHVSDLDAAGLGESARALAASLRNRLPSRMVRILRLGPSGQMSDSGSSVSGQHREPPQEGSS